tara:strand:- start:253 stop:786 length:534 start_codon:yes stop_codon:yes gene_type:complete
MKKLFFTTLTALLFTFTGNTQISATLNGGTLLVSDWDEGAFLGFNLEGKYDINENMRAGIALGFYNWSESENGFKFGLNIIPVSASFEYKILTGDFRPYAGINLGLNRTSSYFKIDGESDRDAENDLSFAPVVGAEYWISDNLGINFNAKYHYILNGDGNVDNLTAIALNLGVVYAF